MFWNPDFMETLVIYLTHTTDTVHLDEKDVMDEVIRCLKKAILKNERIVTFDQVYEEACSVGYELSTFDVDKYWKSLANCLAGDSGMFLKEILSHTEDTPYSRYMLAYQIGNISYHADCIACDIWESLEGKVTLGHINNWITMNVSHERRHAEQNENLIFKAACSLMQCEKDAHKDDREADANLACLYKLQATIALPEEKRKQLRVRSIYHPYLDNFTMEHLTSGEC